MDSILKHQFLRNSTCVLLRRFWISDLDIYLGFATTTLLVAVQFSKLAIVHIVHRSLNAFSSAWAAGCTSTSEFLRLHQCQFASIMHITRSFFSLYISIEGLLPEIIMASRLLMPTAKACTCLQASLVAHEHRIVI